MGEDRQRVLRNTRLVLIAAGVTLIVALHLGVSAYLTRAVTAGLLARDGQVKQQFLSGILAAEGSTTALFDGPAAGPALQSFGAHVRSLPGIVRANIYSPDGVIRQSTDGNLTGVHFDGNTELASAFAGRISTKLEDADGVAKSEHLALNQVAGEALIESYIPVLGRDGKVAAVVEYYTRDDWIRNTVTPVERGIWIAAAASSIILALVIVLATRRRG
jgi:hypothetical protein